MQSKGKIHPPLASSEVTPKDAYLSRRDFMKAATIATGAALLAACAPQYESPIPKYDRNHVTALKFPESAFKPEHVEQRCKIETFGASGEYRVVTLENPELLGLWEPSTNPDQAFIPEFKTAGEAVINTLHRYEKIIQIQAREDNPLTPGQYTWKSLRVNGSSIHSRTAKEVLSRSSNQLQDRWNVDEQSRNTAGSLVHSILYDKSLTNDIRVSLIAELVKPEFQGLMLDQVSKIQQGISDIDPAAPQVPTKPMDEMPAYTPIKTWQDIYMCQYAPPKEPDQCQDIIDAIMLEAGTADCIFVPKADEGLKDQLKHVVDKEFFEIPTPPKVYYVEERNDWAPNGVKKTVYVTHDDQNWKDLYDHSFEVTFEPADVEAGIDSWQELKTPQESLNIAQIHGVTPSDTVKVYQLKDESFSMHLVPNKGFGSPGLVKNEPKLRLVPSVRLKNTEEGQEDNPKILLLAKQLRDMFTPIQNQLLPFDNWLTDVTDTVRKYQGITKYLSKLGLQPPEEFFYRLFMGQESSGSGLHNALIPSNRELQSILLDLYTHAALGGDGESLSKLNWAVGTGEPVAIHRLSGTNFAKALNSTGFEIFQDSFNTAEMLDDLYKPVFLQPGEAVPLGGIIEDNVTHERYLVFGNISSDDNNNFFNRFRNESWSDTINNAYAIKLSDALRHITVLDPNNNILEAMGNLIKIGGPAVILLMTIFSPQTLPGWALAGSVAVSTRANAIWTAIEAGLVRGVSALIP